MLRWLLALVVLGLAPIRTSVPAAGRPVIVASKPFGESYILAEMFAQLLEAHGIRADRRLGLGATQIAYGALRSGAIDVYPEYTGTGLIAILGLPPEPDARAVFAHVAAASAARDSVRWLPPLGFENTYAIAVRRRTADSLHLETLTDLARSGGALRGGFTADFIGRPDGLPGLVRVYSVHLRDVRALLPAVKYAALAAGSIDVIDGFSTDGLIARYDLVVLRDDRHFYPPVRGGGRRQCGATTRQPGRGRRAHGVERPHQRLADAGAESPAGGGRGAGRDHCRGCPPRTRIDTRSGAQRGGPGPQAAAAEGASRSVCISDRSAGLLRP